MGKYLLAGEDDRVAQWVCNRVPMMSLDTPYTAIGLVDRLGNLIAGLVYTNFIEVDIQIHIAALTPRSLTRRFIGEGFRYPFLQLQCRRVTALVSAENARSLRLCDGLGFTREGVLREWCHDGSDCVVFGMLRGECAWLRVGVRKDGTSSGLWRKTDEPRCAPNGRSGTFAELAGDGEPAPRTAA